MRKPIVCIIGLVLLISCSGSAISHDEDMAARSAVEFSKVSLVQHNLQEGYALLSDNAKGTRAWIWKGDAP